MDIKRRMVKEFTFLSPFSCVLGGISFFRICEMDKNYKNLAL
ncbi:MAG: hypothetical protein ACFFBC_01765 [Promethearchaeota archaeon]